MLPLRDEYVLTISRTLTIFNQEKKSPKILYPAIPITVIDPAEYTKFIIKGSDEAARIITKFFYLDK